MNTTNHTYDRDDDFGHRIHHFRTLATAHCEYCNSKITPEYDTHYYQCSACYCEWHIGCFEYAGQCSNAKHCVVPNCPDPAVGQCMSCDGWRCGEHSSYSNEAGERFCSHPDHHKWYWKQSPCDAYAKEIADAQAR